METEDTRKARAMALMVEGKKQVNIAKILAVSTRTVRRWAAEPEFARELKEERSAFMAIERVQSAVASLEKIEECTASTKFLAQIRDSERIALAVRMRAAVMLMNEGHKVSVLIMREERAEKRRAEKADKSGHGGQSGNGDMSVPFRVPTSIPASSIFKEDGEKRTKPDTPAEFAVRQARLEACEQEMQKYEELELKVKSTPNLNREALKKFNDDLENARIEMERTMGAIDNADPEAISSIQIKPVVVELPK